MSENRYYLELFDLAGGETNSDGLADARAARDMLLAVSDWLCDYRSGVRDEEGEETALTQKYDELVHGLSGLCDKFVETIFAQGGDR